ncbi:ERCC4/XP-G-type excision repair nuclease [Cryptosporidium felis]|nr:ERCC4/XP-G-type excision repair nuclease [Cryptosporidium felis]
MELLPFQESIQNDLEKNKSCLIVLSKGLGVFNIAYNYLNHLEICNGNSVFILNLSIPEIVAFKLFVVNMDNGLNYCFTDSANKTSLSEKLGIINSEMNLSRRLSLYESGGVHIITSRIFLTDLLSEKIDYSHIDGIIVFNAENLSVRNWNDAFILQLIKKKNPKAFIKGISQRPDVLNHGYFGPGIAMKYLGTSTMCLYPRKNTLVEKSFKLSHEIRIIEKAVKATESFYLIQNCFFSLLEKGMNEILKLDSNIELSIPELVHCSQRKLQNKIELITLELWNRITPRIRQVTKDIIILRNLLDLLYILDSSRFFFCLEFIRSKKLIDPSWTLTTEFETLYKASRRRVFRVKNEISRNNLREHENSCFFLSLEVNPIHIQLIDILCNIGDELKEEDISALIEEEKLRNINKNILHKDKYSDKKLIDVEEDGIFPGKLILNDEFENENKMDIYEFFEEIAVFDSNTPNSEQKTTLDLPEYKVLIISPDDLFLSDSDMKFLVLNGPQNFSIAKFKELHQNMELDLLPISNILPKIVPNPGFLFNMTSIDKSGSLNQLKFIISTLMQNCTDVHYSQDSKESTVYDLPNSTLSECNQYFKSINRKNKINPKILISNYNTNIQGKLWNTLLSHSPHLIIILDPEISILREIELFSAITITNKRLIPQVILITIQNSIKHEKFLMNIKNEENAWESLERHRKTLVVPLSDFTEGEILTKLSNTITGRINQDENTNNFQKVIVDIREFRSSLPYKLFCKGVQIIPLTLEIGDYVISRDVCIERKSINDLLISLTNGRLFTQIQWIVKHYSVPVVLIELDSTESLDRQGTQHSFAPMKFNTRDMYLRLVLLIRQFPNVKLIWSSNSSFSSLIILHMKFNREQPNLTVATALNTSIIKDEGDYIINKNDKRPSNKKKKRKIVSDSAKSNFYALALLRHLPGVNARNIKALTSNFNSIKDICNASLEQLIPHLGIPNGTSLFRALHENNLHIASK